jgi:phosphate transport system protein
MEEPFSSHISRQFNAELEALRKDVMAMGGMVERMIAEAIGALVDSDVPRAQAVIAADDQVNQLEKAIDERAIELLARRQPTASDLRLVMAIIKTVNDLERVGDEAEKIAKMAIVLADHEPPRTHYYELESMAKHVRQMLREALDGFARMVPEVAVTLFKADQKVDDDYEAMLRQYYTYIAENPRSTPMVLNAIWIARALERIGDHAKNIGEYVFFLVEGRDMRHTSQKEKAAALRQSSDD